MRSCGSCTLCCKVMIVVSLEKPGGVWCEHCEPASGCRIYDRRPNDCRNFACGFLLNENLGEHWRPSTSHIIVVANHAQGRYEFHVDRLRPDAWRRQPYHSELRTLARHAAAQQMIVMVFIGARIWAVYADRDVDLGILEPGDRAEAHFVGDGLFEVVKISAGARTEPAS